MSISNYRNKAYDTVHHLTSRTAHRVFFLKDEENDELLEIIRRAAEFCGIRLLNWCLMTNHFHLLVHLPEPIILDETEVLRRYGVLKGDISGRAAGEMLASFHMRGYEDHVAEWLNGQRRRMYDIGSFMKIVKQWFTTSYNRRHEHIGTFWESVYRDHVIPQEGVSMRNVAGYQHLNPIRSAICAGFSEYKWSSMTACVNGDQLAIDGLRFVYGDYVSDGPKLLAKHTALLEEMLETEKLKHAVEIARKRAAGFDIPPDPLTTEAMIAQQLRHIETVQNALIEIHAENKATIRGCKKHKACAANLLSVIRVNPQADTSALAKLLGVSLRTVQSQLKLLEKQGAITRPSPRAHWTICNNFVLGLT